MPTAGDSVLFWALLEMLGLVGTLRKLWLGIEGVELLLLRRGGGVRTVDAPSFPARVSRSPTSSGTVSEPSA